MTGAGGPHRLVFRLARPTKKYDLRLMVRDKDEDSSAIRKLMARVVRCDLARTSKTGIAVRGYRHRVAPGGRSRRPRSDLGQRAAKQRHRALTIAMVAARAAGCRRLIYASSIHAVSGYPQEDSGQNQRAGQSGRPLRRHQMLSARRWAATWPSRRDLSVIALRIGGFQPESTAEEPGLGADGWLGLAAKI